MKRNVNHHLHSDFHERIDRIAGCLTADWPLAQRLSSLAPATMLLRERFYVKQF